jgi:crotonobetainyl-CoA:carnitine CoA-transferase CaiB-like acyl-CoA transferase
MLVELQDAEVGSITVSGLPIKLSLTPGKVAERAPRLGEHTEEVLAEWLGLPPETITQLRADGIV